MIHIDAELSCLPNRQWRWNVVTHLFCAPGELAALHAFAQRLGLQRRWFQTGTASTMPHYDLAPGKRWQALHLGAIELSREATVAVMREWRAWKVTLSPDSPSAAPRPTGRHDATGSDDKLLL